MAEVRAFKCSAAAFDFTALANFALHILLLHWIPACECTFSKMTTVRTKDRTDSLFQLHHPFFYPAQRAGGCEYFNASEEMISLMNSKILHPLKTPETSASVTISNLCVTRSEESDEDIIFDEYGMDRD